MTQLVRRRSDLDTEMTVVRNEFESGENNPQRVLWQKMQASAYDWHNYGKSTIGARSDIENVDIERLRGVLPDVLPARQRGADRRRQVRSGEDARADRRSTSARSRSRRARCRASTRPSPCRTASASVTRAPRRQRAVRRRDVPHAAGRASGLRGDRRARRDHDASRRPAGCTRRWSRPSKATQRPELELRDRTTRAR